MAFDDKGKERRISLILLQYWNALREDRPFPSEDEVDPDQLTHVWAHCFLLQLRDIEQVVDYNYSYLGPEIVKPYETGMLDAENTTMISPNANRLAASFQHVIETEDPLLDEGECLTTSGDLVRFRQCMMPLGTDGKIHSILGGAWYKLFKEDA
jgi:hypothetical protein